MRSFIFAIVILALITVFVIFSSIYTANFCDTLLSILDSCPDTTALSVFDTEKSEIDADKIFMPLINEWEKHKLFVRCTVGHAETEEIDDAISDMKARYLCGDSGGYLSAKFRVKSLIEELKKAECLSFYALG